MRLMRALAGACAAVAVASAANAQTKLTIATVNNGDMIRMEKLVATSSRRTRGST